MTGRMDLGRVAGPGGEEPTFDGLSVQHEAGRSLRVATTRTELLRYVYAPWDPPVEAPRPYFHGLRTLAGNLVSLYRPHDHVWHKGLAWSLCHVGPENFWGGPTYVADTGYRLLDNHGTVHHISFDGIRSSDCSVYVSERLTWAAHDGQTLVDESRNWGVSLHQGVGAWQLTFTSSMTNVSDDDLVFGSPTTHGRPNAGYGGLMWRGPRSFTDGLVVTPTTQGGDDLMGWRGPWMAYVGRLDGAGTACTLLFREASTNFSFPTKWFVRSTPYACLCPSPFFDTEYVLKTGDALSLSYDVHFCDGAQDAAGCRDILQATSNPPICLQSPLGL